MLNGLVMLLVDFYRSYYTFSIVNDMIWFLIYMQNAISESVTFTLHFPPIILKMHYGNKIAASLLLLCSVILLVVFNFGIFHLNHQQHYNNSIILFHLMYEKDTKYMPQREISNNVVCATSKASDQSVHTHSLTRAFASRLNILWLLSYWLNITWSF